MKNKTLFGLLSLLVVGAAVFALSAGSRQKVLETYVPYEEQPTYKSFEKEETQPQIIMQEYSDDSAKLRIDIPSEWVRITKDGYTTFVQKETGASVQIRISDYDPSVNNVSESGISASIVEKGYYFTGFSLLASQHYELLYQDKKDVIYDYIEDVYWDREEIVSIIYTMKDSDYDSLVPYLDKMRESFMWEPSSPIPAGYHLYYNYNLDFELGIPDAWTFGESEAAVYATDETSGAVMMLQTMENSTSFSDITASDIASLLSENRSGFMMHSYQASEDKGYAVCSFTENQKRYGEEVYGFSTGQYLFFLSFVYEEGTQDTEIAKTCSSLFRIFNSNGAK